MNVLIPIAGNSYYIVNGKKMVKHLTITNGMSLLEHNLRFYKDIKDVKIHIVANKNLLKLKETYSIIKKILGKTPYSITSCDRNTKRALLRLSPSLQRNP